MKKLFTIFCILGTTTTLHAQLQVPNADFENWTLEKPAYNFYSPDDWTDGSACVTPQGGQEVCSFTQGRTKDAHAGTYALTQYTDKVGNSINNLPLWNIKDDFTTPPFTGRPGSFSFYYKYVTNESLTMEVTVTLYTGSLTGDYTVIGDATYTFSASTGTYQKADADFTYYSTDAPTNVFISSDYMDDPKNAEDTLKLDSFVFNYITTDVNDPHSPDFFTVSATDKILTSSKAIDQATFIDLSGKTVASFDDQTSAFNLADQKAGLYILKGNINEMPFTRKVLVE